MNLIIYTNYQWNTYAYTDPQKEQSRQTALTNKLAKPDVIKIKRPEKKAWSDKTAIKEKRGEQREKRKMIKDKQRKEREEQREREQGDEDAEVVEDWKVLRRERKRAKLEKVETVETNGDVEFDL
jgi:hypothetical protein